MVYLETVRSLYRAGQGIFPRGAAGIFPSIGGPVSIFLSHLPTRVAGLGFCSGYVCPDLDEARAAATPHRRHKRPSHPSRL